MSQRTGRKRGGKHPTSCRLALRKAMHEAKGDKIAKAEAFKQYQKCRRAHRNDPDEQGPEPAYPDPASGLI